MAQADHSDKGAGRPRLTAADAAIIERFADSLWMERGLSGNTLSSYQSDLRLAANWLAGENSSLEKARRTDLLAYLASLVDQQVKPRTSARRLSSLRQFFARILKVFNCMFIHF